MSTTPNKYLGRSITNMWIDDWVVPKRPCFFLKRMGLRHYAVTNAAGELVHHIRGTRPEARGEFDAYVRKLEKITTLLST